jgi:hypothetical protein
MRAGEFISEMAGEIHVGVGQELARQGYEYLGSGIDKQAYLEPGTGKVLIVFGYRRGVEDFSPDQRMFINWINYCNKHRDNPHLPRFSGFESFKFQGKNYLQARMEKLQELPDAVAYLVSNIRDAIQEDGTKDLKKLFHRLAVWATGDSWEGDDPEQYDVKTVINYLGGKKSAQGLVSTVQTVSKFAKKNGYRVDLHRDNYMQRPNGTIVVNDPFVIFLHGS